MNAAIREAGERQAAAIEAARKLEEERRVEAETRMQRAQRSIDLLHEALETLGSLLVENADPEARFGRRPQYDPLDRNDVFYLPATSHYVRWYTPKQRGWYLTTSARWDGAIKLLGEADLRVAVLANGKLSRTIPLDSTEARQDLAREIVECAARHDLRWPVDGPDLTLILEGEDVD